MIPAFLHADTEKLRAWDRGRRELEAFGTRAKVREETERRGAFARRRA